MSATTDVPFRLLDDLPVGRLAIQASAGTGKTFALAALATRFIAERDVAAADLLIVTFTRAATSELRSRVRDRLVAAAEHLSVVPPPPTDDELLVHLGSQDREVRLARIQRAITEFDAATITTIHGFATQVLGTLGTTAGTDPDATLVDDSAELAAACCADVLAAAATTHPIAVLPTHRVLVESTRNAINISDLVLEPTDDQDGAAPKDRMLVELVEASIAMMRLRRRESGTLSFDDILVELRRALGGSGSAAAIETLRSRFKVALIDEFQDTDPVQWDIFRTLFADDSSSDAALVLVGDPKQAIYAFRGANVHTYIDAVGAGSGTMMRTLGTNWRSDAAVLDATEVLLDGTTYGTPEISFSRVDAAAVNEGRRLRTGSGEPLPALALRLAVGSKLKRTKKGDVDLADAKKAIYEDLVAQIRTLLDHAHLPLGDGPPSDALGARVRPSDIAVLVRATEEAEDVQAALLAQGVPAVLARGGSVLASPAAEQWRWLFEALLRPSDLSRARTFAYSWFCGRSPEWIHRATDDELAALQEQLHDWAETLLERGLTEFIRRVWTESGVVARVLERPDGDRCMTDLDHVAELLQAAAPTGRSSVAGLLAVLDAPPAIEVDADIDRDVASRRVESEAQAVQIMTIWVAKGLEFPIVCCPTLWRTPNSRVIYQDPDTERRTYDLAAGSGWPDKAGAAERKARAAAEAAGENLRLLYVAVTRAKHQTLVWWTNYSRSNTSALGRVLFARQDGVIAPDVFAAAKVPLPDDAECEEVLRPLVARSNGTITMGVHGRVAPPDGPWVDSAAATDHPPMAVARLDRTLDRSAHRWSFTSITSREQREHGDPYDVSLADAGAADEQNPDEVPDTGDDREIRADGRTTDGRLTNGRSMDGGQVSDGGAASPASGVDPAAGLSMLPAGAAFGTLVHSVLEEIDFTDSALDEAIAIQVDEQLAWRSMDLTPVGLDGVDADDGRRLLIEGLRAAIDTPLGPMLGGARLRDIPPADRLDEMSFELLLGDTKRRATDRQIGKLVMRHVPPGDLFGPQPMHDWATQLADGAFSVSLAGHLTGSIDAVLRVRDEHGTPRFVVVDYKTNRLSERGQLPGPDDYRPDHMAAAMADHHYPLQALLYSVALHRYLRWRLPDYEPQVHLGGAAYLFLRGMTGPDVPTTDGEPHGVFTWSIPPALVTDLSDLLDGRRITGLGS